MDKKKSDSILPPYIQGATDRVAFYGYTCIGGRNEDQDYMAHEVANGNEIFLVCDGMGGHAGGCVASATAAQTLLETFRHQTEVLPADEAVIMAVKAANDAVYKKSQEEASLRGMGTTLTLLLIDAHAAYVTHIGDSRVYQLRRGRKIFRTFDHSLVFEHVAKDETLIQRLRRRFFSHDTQYITEEEARVHPRANILSKAIGIMPELEIEVSKLEYREGDRFILCCDGVWNTQPEPEIISMFTSHADLEATVKSTQSMVEKIGKEKGGLHDNHTMIAVDVRCCSEYKTPLLSRL
mgnify:CR=1 FL=1